MVVNLAIGFITPPVGVNLFVACGIGGIVCGIGKTHRSILDCTFDRPCDYYICLQFR